MLYKAHPTIIEQAKKDCYHLSNLMKDTPKESKRSKDYYDLQNTAIFIAKFLDEQSPLRFFESWLSVVGVDISYSIG